MLIDCDRLTAADRVTWRIAEATDALYARTNEGRLADLARRSMRDIASFWSRDQTGYAGVSWGKDSVVLAHLVARLRASEGLMIPLVWVRVEGRENPHCPPVRDAFLATHAVDYHELTSGAGDTGGGKLTSEQGFDEAARRFGDRHISGVRRDESYAREMRYRGHGISSARTCAPLSNWIGLDIFAYAYAHELPLHPAYAMSAGGRFPRAQLRVASLGGLRGTQYGRREWEMLYYRPELRAAGLDHRRI